MKHEKPHTLSMYLDGDKVSFSAECPYTTLDRPCALFLECTAHPEPDEPEDDASFPPFLWKDGKVVRDAAGHPRFTEDASPEWKQYQIDYDEWAKLHEAGEEDVYHRVNSCWVEEWVENDTLGNGWELSGFTAQEVTGPIPVDWSNQSNLVDSFLRLTPWKDDSGPAHD